MCHTTLMTFSLCQHVATSSTPCSPLPSPSVLHPAASSSSLITTNTTAPSSCSTSFNWLARRRLLSSLYSFSTSHSTRSSISAPHQQYTARTTDSFCLSCRLIFAAHAVSDVEAREMVSTHRALHPFPTGSLLPVVLVAEGRLGFVRDDDHEDHHDEYYEEHGDGEGEGREDKMRRRDDAQDRGSHLSDPMDGELPPDHIVGGPAGPELNLSPPYPNFKHINHEILDADSHSDALSDAGSEESSITVWPGGETELREVSASREEQQASELWDCEAEMAEMRMAEAQGENTDEHGFVLQKLYARSDSGVEQRADMVSKGLSK